MARYAWFLPGALALALLAGACTFETTVLPEDTRPTITVAGSGTASGSPDIALLTFGVEAEAESVAAARDRAAEAMSAVLDALRADGVAEEDIQTTRFSIQPRYEFPDGRQVLVGFVVSNVVTVKIRDLDNVGRLIDAPVAAGGDLVRIENLRFTIDDPSTLQAQAREEAMREARERAETLARAAGVSLGPPVSITESGGPVPIALEAAAARELLEAETPIEPGELEVRVDVQVAYAIEE